MGNKFEELPLFLTPQQLAHLTGEHVNSIRRGITEGRIPADKVNGRWRICRDAVFARAKEGLLFGEKVER
ncbi:helix-turn-helix domain-containing protein [Adlercreutzia sp. ZJ138]|uniref:helix-turn-helix domain-containing protein n=1 Tax=Adlercreutzia sp. ZJ138 TaxID=2709405 RepID=UPI0013EC8A73|nr:helix-turn-helix domain-containing protein [Adlercreutzia sp. ZJ138]